MPAATKQGAMNRNVRLNLIQTGLLAIADSIWTGTVLAAFVYIMQRDHTVKNTSVGMVEMAFGLSQLVSAFPVGYLADKKGRAPLIRVGGALSILAAIATGYVVWETTEEDIEKGSTPAWAMWALAGCMCVWGVVSGIASGPSQALYADSVPEGERSKWFNYLYWTYLLGSTVGPATTVALFHIYGNGWSLRELRIVFLVGLGFELIVAIPSFFYSDKAALPEEEGDPVKKDRGDLRSTEFPLDIGRCVRRRHIPYILFAGDLLTALGSGMTVKFFPLFFKNTLHLSPADVQTVYVVLRVVMACASGIGMVVARRTGRVSATIGLSYLGLGCLLTMALCYDKMPAIPLIVIFMVRTGLMNSTYPLRESILMDSVPKDQRARWKALDSVSTFGWCGSAAFGGFLADRYGYTFTFFITAGLQFVGVSMYWLIMHVVPREIPVESGPKTGEQEPLLVDPGDPTPVN